MSLIQEALRRKAKDAGEIPVELPPEPTPAPGVAPPLRRRAQRRRAPKAGLWILIFCLLGGIGRALYYFRERLPAVPRTSPEAARARVVSQGPVEVTERAFSSEPISEETLTPEEQSEPAPAPALPTPPVSSEVQEPVAPKSAEITRQEKKVTPPEAADIVPLAPEKIPWPSLKLQGVMTRGGAGQRNSAFINTEMVEEGERIEGVRLAQVESAGVWLEFRDERKFLRVGQTLP